MRLGSLVRVDPANSLQVLPSVWKVDGALERARGLLGRPALEWGQALWIEPCNNVHTFGMRYALDLAFLDALGVVKKLVRDVQPLRMSGAWGARATVEMRSGQLERMELCVGDVLVWQPLS